MKPLKKTVGPSAKRQEASRETLREAVDFQNDDHPNLGSAPMIHASQSAAPAKILVVSNHLAARSALRKELQAAHYDVIAAEYAGEGMNLAATIQPALILLEMTGPLTDALDISKRLKNSSTTRSIPLIFLTTVGRVEEIMAGLGLDAVDCVVRPYHPEELLARIRKALALRNEQETFGDEIQQFKSRLVGRVSNALRNHVTVIAGFASLLEQKLNRSDASMSSAYLQEIIQQVNHLSDLTEGFEGLFRKEPAFEEVGLIQLLQGTVERFRHRFERKGQRLILKVPPHDPLVLRGNRHDLFTAFSYLLSNAHRFTAAGGIITLHVLSMDHQARIEITHTGIGLSPESSGQESVDGETSPLGLTIAQSIAERHDGGLGVENQPGQGGRFWMILPLNRCPAESNPRSGP